jgi:hypothetical protein
MRERLERARAQVAAGTFRAWYRAAEEPVAPQQAEDLPPGDPVDWIGWRLRHGLTISSDILERELRLNWRQASEAFDKWRQRLESEAAGQ